MSYLERMNARRGTYTGIQRTWADYNIACDIIDSDKATGKRPDKSMYHIAISACREIIEWLEKQPRSKDILDALEVKINELADLRMMK